MSECASKSKIGEEEGGEGRGRATAAAGAVPSSFFWCYARCLFKFVELLNSRVSPSFIDRNTKKKKKQKEMERGKEKQREEGG